MAADGESPADELVRELRENTAAQRASAIAQRELARACERLATEFAKVLSVEPPRGTRVSTETLGEVAGEVAGDLAKGAVASLFKKRRKP